MESLPLNLDKNDAHARCEGRENKNKIYYCLRDSKIIYFIRSCEIHEWRQEKIWRSEKSFKDNFLIDFPLDWFELFSLLGAFSRPLTISSLVFRPHFSLSRILRLHYTANKAAKQLCRCKLTPERWENGSHRFKSFIIFFGVPQRWTNYFRRPSLLQW